MHWARGERASSREDREALWPALALAEVQNAGARVIQELGRFAS